MDLSIVIPAYNEADRLPETLRRIAAYFQNDSRTFEIIVVDDGSTDATVQLAEQAPIPVRVIRQPKNMGKGAAVRTGMAAAQGEWRYLCDADLSTPIEDLEKLWSRRAEADIILGSRRMPGSQVMKHQSRLKEIFGQLGNLLIQLLVAPGIHDTRCGFKLFSARTKKVFQVQRLNNFSYDDEIIFIARHHHLRVLEVPVRWVNDERSKVKMSDYLKTLSDLVKIRYFQTRGFYTFS